MHPPGSSRCGHTIQVRRFEDGDALSRRLAALLRSHLERSAPANEPHAVMLAGGRTPLDAYRLMANQPFAVSHAAYVLFSDERMVPADSDASNFARIAPMLSALAIPRHRLMVLDTERATEEAAAQYHEEISRFLELGGRITLGLLGLGADGHTAGLFSTSDLEKGGNRFAVGVRRPDGRDGVSVTPHLLERVGQLVFLATGEDKRNAAHKLLKETLAVPAGMAVARHPHVELWVDPHAYPLA